MAAKEFQTKMKFKADGIVGPKTWDALHNEALKAQFDNCFATHDWFSLLELKKIFAGLATLANQSAAAASNAIHKLTTPATLPNKTPSTTQTTNAVTASTIVKPTDFKNYQRTSFQGYIIKDFKKFENGAIQLRPAIKIIEPRGTMQGAPT